MPPSDKSRPSTRSGAPAAGVCRVAVVLSELRAGGMERVVTHLAGALSQRGIEPLVLCLQRPGPLADDLTDRDVRVEAIGSIKGWDVRGLARLARRLREFAPDVIHVHDNASLPYVSAAGLVVGAPIVFTAHGLLYEGFERPRLRYRLAARGLSAVTAVSDEVSARHRSHLAWGGEIETIPNGVPAVRRNGSMGARVRRELEIPDGATVFLAMGNARPEKGFEDLLSAAAILRDELGSDAFGVLIAGRLGRDAYSRALRATHERLGLGKVVQFLGYRSDTRALYSAAHAFVLSSRSEGLPMVVLEAMTAGLPIVATRVGGVPDALEDGAGILVAPASAEELAAGMGEIVAAPRAARRLGEAARRRARERYSVARMTDRYVRVYRRVATGRRRNARAGRPGA